jgi:putative thiamine transport system ATP-binding protein
MNVRATFEHGLAIRDVAIVLAGKTLVRFDGQILPGEALTVMGPSGIGKSTLLAFVAGFLAPDFSASGRIVVDGRDVTALPPQRRGIGLLFQDALLLPHLSVAGNLLIGLHPAVKGRHARRQAVEAALAEIGLKGFASRDPATLSGGQAARVALMRTLLARPQALVLDEPFSRLDAALRAQIRELVFAETRRHGLPVLLATHDPADAEAAGGRIVELR